MPEPQPTPPLSAYIKRADAGETLVALAIFDKEVTVKPFLGNRHRERAESFVSAWNDHLIKEWLAVKETSACIMQNFTTALHGLGVEETTINRAMERVRRHATQ